MKALNVTKELENILLEILAQEGDDPDAALVNFRFGIACFAVATLTATLAVFFQASSHVLACALIVTALCEAVAGAVFVDRSTAMTRRMLRNRKKDAAASPHD